MLLTTPLVELACVLIRSHRQDKALHVEKTSTSIVRELGISNTISPACHTRYSPVTSERTSRGILIQLRHSKLILRRRFSHRAFPVSPTWLASCQRTLCTLQTANHTSSFSQKPTVRDRGRSKRKRTLQNRIWQCLDCFRATIGQPAELLSITPCRSGTRGA